MSKLFISDLHLEENRPDITDIFLRFLGGKAQEAQELYILGDLFEVWIGDDNRTDFNNLIIHAFQKATDAGLAIYIMHGNRDFLLGKKFFKATGCQPLSEEYLIDIYGERVLLMHGDTLCLEDEAYLKFRKKVRNKFFQTLFLWKSLKSRRAISENYRAKSKEYTSTAANNIMDVTQQEVENKMKQHNVKYLIHGHTHRQAIHKFQLNHQNAERIVLGAWHEKGNALSWDRSGKKEFISF